MTPPTSIRVPVRGRLAREGARLVPHHMAFPSAMMSLKVFMGFGHRVAHLEAHNQTWLADHDYYLHLGVSGEGFRFLYDVAEGFRFQDPSAAEPVRDCLAAEGLPCQLYAAKPVLGLDGIWTDEAALRSLTVQHLAKGLPALLLGRSDSDWVLLVTGYEQSGDTLVAWTFAPGNDVPNKSFSPEDCQFVHQWWSGADALILVGEPTIPEDRAAVCERALRRGADLLRCAEGHPHSQDVHDLYDAWIAPLQDDATWARPFDDRPGIDPEIWDLAERRAFCAEFLVEASDVLGTTYLDLAIDAFRRIHDLMWEINALCAGEESTARLRDPNVRQAIVVILEQCRVLDGQAAQAIDDCLKSYS
ncbi:MAG: hypothetical protein ACYC5M_12070 [Anaerolineae bacterium]